MRCPNCESETRPWNAFGHCRVLRCRAGDCGFRFIDPATLHAPSNDYHAGWSTHQFNDTAPWILARVGLVRRFKAHGLVADLGCGIGETAVALHKAGYAVTGVEESEQAISFLKANHPAIEWHRQSIMNFFAGNSRRFDAITLFHLLEHLPRPKQAVHLVQAALKPDGALVVEVPDAGGGQARLAGMNWRYFHPHHLNYFDRRSLAKLLGAFGFRLAHLEKTYHFSHPQGHAAKDLIKSALARAGYNAILRTVWLR